jgi:hypothetical protein
MDECSLIVKIIKYANNHGSMKLVGGQVRYTSFEDGLGEVPVLRPRPASISLVEGGKRKEGPWQERMTGL